MRYQPSRRPYPEQLAPEESFYLDDVIRQVKSKGEITFNNHFFFIGRACTGSPVALRPRATGVWDVYYCWKQLGTINLNTTYKQKGRYHSIKTELSSMSAHKCPRCLRPLHAERACSRQATVSRIKRSV